MTWPIKLSSCVLVLPYHNQINAVAFLDDFFFFVHRYTKLGQNINHIAL